MESVWEERRAAADETDFHRTSGLLVHGLLLIREHRSGQLQRSQRMAGTDLTQAAGRKTAGSFRWEQPRRRDLSSSVTGRERERLPPSGQGPFWAP